MNAASRQKPMIPLCAEGKRLASTDTITALVLNRARAAWQSRRARRPGVYIVRMSPTRDDSHDAGDPETYLRITASRFEGPLSTRSPADSTFN